MFLLSDTGIKVCSRCKETKSLNEFQKHLNQAQGRYAYCKCCTTQINKISREQAPNLSSDSCQISIKDIQRFWSKVEKTESCWNWTQGLDRRGYGQIKISARNYGAHRLSWFIHNGSIPTNLSVCHRCDRPSCIRPDHLFLGTHAENMADMHKKNRHRVGSKLTAEQVRQIKQMYQEGITQSEIASIMNVTFSNISYILSGKTWKHIV